MNIEPNVGRDHAPTVSLTTAPEQHPAVFAEAFNTGRADAVAQVYEPGAVFVPHPGQQVTGDALAKATADFLALGLPISVQPRHTYVADDIALLIVDWVIDGPGPGGASTCTLRARRRMWHAGARMAGGATGINRSAPGFSPVVKRF
ncbi:YybH family protein [Streptomyces sp. NPDC052236]|uniref:YybH family protein n=1 Tax=Streptomyces sp. NPDC052236 TaxID=3365686 RepID=UPI0037D694D9